MICHRRLLSALAHIVLLLPYIVAQDQQQSESDEDALGESKYFTHWSSIDTMALSVHESGGKGQREGLNCNTYVLAI